jgi:PAS domain S-box-containing protein
VTSSGGVRPVDRPDIETIDSLGIGIVSIDRSWRMTQVNAAAEAILGVPGSYLVGRDLWEQFPGARELEFGRAYQSVMQSGKPTSFDAFYPGSGTCYPGSGTWFELQVRPIPEGIVCYFLDITARKAAEQAVADAAARSRFAADAMETLATSLDVAANVERVARLVVPRLCTWSTVVAVDEDGLIVASSSWHVDPDRRSDAAAFVQAQLTSSLGPLSSRAILDGELIVHPREAHKELRSSTDPGLARQYFDALAPQGIAVVPMRARGRTVGVMTLYSDTPWTEGELAEARDLARDVAARAAVAIDNSAAYARVQTARDGAQAAIQRLSLLADVSDVLAGADDTDVAIGKLARLVVPQLADWSLISVVDDDGTLRDVGYAHRDPAKEKVLALYSARRSE